MRNLKRALSLALASVMVLGLMIVGTSAASYPDVDSEDNVEAIEVLKAVGVMEGDTDGNFNPDQNVTREEMATIMCHLMDYKVSTYAGTCPFSDVSTWAEPYVAACYTHGIVAGYSATTFGAKDNVTAVQASLMMLKALGYFQYQSDFGESYKLSTLSKANQIDLYEGVDVAADEAMTRNDIAQIALNTLKSTQVYVTATPSTMALPDGTVVELNGAQYGDLVKSGDRYTTIHGRSANDPYYGVDKYTAELGEDLYAGLLRLRDTTDGFGAPAQRWTYNNKEIGVYADTATYVFEGKVKSNAVYAAVGSTVAKTYKWNPTLIDGYADSTALFDQADVIANNRDDLAGPDRGTTTYVYVDEAEEEVTVCIINQYAGEIVEVDGDTITVADAADGGDLDFDAPGYDVKDVVLYTKSKATKSSKSWTAEQVIGAPERVEGEATRIQDLTNVTVDGTTYNYSVKCADNKLGTASVGETVAFYLDTQGNYIKTDEATESNDYAYVYSVGSSTNLYGKNDNTFGAKLILTDGTVMNVTLHSDTTDKADVYQSGSSGKVQVSAAANKVDYLVAMYEGEIVTYTEEDDGAYNLTLKTYDGTWATVKDTENEKTLVGKAPAASGHAVSIGAGKTVLQNGGSRVTLDNSKYAYTDKNSAILVNEDASKADFHAYVGYDNAPNVDVASDDSTKVVYYEKNGVVKALYVVGGEASGSVDDVIFVIGQDASKLEEIKDGSDTYYKFDAVRNGEVIELKVTTTGNAYENILSQLKKDQVGVYFGCKTNSKGYVTDLTIKTPTGVEVNNTGNSAGSGYGLYKAWEGTERLNNGATVGFGYVSVREYSAYVGSREEAWVATKAADITVGNLTGVATDRNDEAYLVTENGKAIAVFIMDIDDDKGTTPKPSRTDIGEFQVDVAKTGNNEITLYHSKNGKTAVPTDPTELAAIVRDVLREEGLTIAEDGVALKTAPNVFNITVVTEKGIKMVYEYTAITPTNSYTGYVNDKAAFVEATGSKNAGEVLIKDTNGTTIKVSDLKDGTGVMANEATGITGANKGEAKAFSEVTITGHNFDLSTGYAKMTFASETEGTITTFTGASVQWAIDGETIGKPTDDKTGYYKVGTEISAKINIANWTPGDTNHYIMVTPHNGTNSGVAVVISGFDGVGTKPAKDGSFSSNGKINFADDVLHASGSVTVTWTVLANDESTGIKLDFKAS